MSSNQKTARTLKLHVLCQRQPIKRFPCAISANQQSAYHMGLGVFMQVWTCVAEIERLQCFRDEISNNSHLPNRTASRHRRQGPTKNTAASTISSECLTLLTSTIFCGLLVLVRTVMLHSASYPIMPRMIYLIFAKWSVLCTNVYKLYSYFLSVPDLWLGCLIRVVAVY
jgi:hypothetical protein